MALRVSAALPVFYVVPAGDVIRLSACLERLAEEMTVEPGELVIVTRDEELEAVFAAIPPTIVFVEGCDAGALSAEIRRATRAFVVDAGAAGEDELVEVLEKRDADEVLRLFRNALRRCAAPEVHPEMAEGRA